MLSGKERSLCGILFVLSGLGDALLKDGRVLLRHELAHVLIHLRVGAKEVSQVDDFINVVQFCVLQIPSLVILL